MSMETRVTIITDKPKGITFASVAHYFIGCFVQVTKIQGIEGVKYVMLLDELLYFQYRQGLVEMKPILIPLVEENITQEENDILFNIVNTGDDASDMENVRAQCRFTKQLIDYHFDVYELIPKDEAIDVLTLEFNPYVNIQSAQLS